MSPRVVFPTPRLLREFEDIDGLLWEVFLEVIERAWPSAAVDCRVVCIHRTPAEEKAAGGLSGIHVAGPPHRALDIGGRDLSQSQMDAVATIINQKWVYDPSRPHLKVCFVQPHGTGPHLHLQVSYPHTKRST